MGDNSSTTPVRVAYILGAARSGSTIFSQLLGEVPGVFFAGEVIHLWDQSLLLGDRCGCGEDVRDCPVWSRVLHRALPDLTPEDVHEMLAIRDAEVRSHALLAQRLPAVARPMSQDLDRYRRAHERLFSAMREVTGADVIVDSSKNAAHAAVLGASPHLDVTVIHLVRDPRATAFSWGRSVEGLGRLSPARASLQWDVRNAVAASATSRRGGQYVRVHYEDFVADPERTIVRVLEALGVVAAPSFGDHAGNFALSPNHSLHGNPRRFESGPVTIELDDEWTRVMGTERHLVTALTLPLLLRYGYPLRPRTARRRARS